MLCVTYVLFVVGLNNTFLRSVRKESLGFTIPQTKTTLIGHIYGGPKVHCMLSNLEEKSLDHIYGVHMVQYRIAYMKTNLIGHIYGGPKVHCGITKTTLVISTVAKWYTPCAVSAPAPLVFAL